MLRMGNLLTRSVLITPSVMRRVFNFYLAPLALRCWSVHGTMARMANRSKFTVFLVVCAITCIAVMSIVLRHQLRCAGFPGPGVTAADLPSTPDSESDLRIVAWNVRNFPLDERPQDADLAYSRRTNICDFEEVFRGLDGDLWALQEVNDIRRFGPILRRATGERSMEVRYSSNGGRHGQHLAIAWDADVLELVGEPIEIAAVAMEPGMRPAYAAYFRSLKTGGLDFTFVTVHHESTVKGFADRRRQNRALAEWIAARVEEIDDPDVIVAGDFNTAGSPRGGFDGELQSIDAILGEAELMRLANTTGCSSYWEGRGERDGIQVPSMLDHVFLRGFNSRLVTVPLQAWLHCARSQCKEIVSRPGEEDGTFWDVSDHCPLTFELRDAQPETQSSEF